MYKKLVGTILAVLMCFQLITPTFATAAGINVLVSEERNGIITYEIAKKEDTYYFFEIIDGVTVAGTLGNDLIFNYYLKTVDGRLIEGSIEYEGKYRISQYEDIFYAAKRDILCSGGQFPGVSKTTSYSDYIYPKQTVSEKVQNEISLDEKNKIDSCLFENYNQPRPYTEKYLGAYGTTEHRAELYETLLYLYSNQEECFLIQAYTVISLIATIVSLPTSKVALIVSLTLDATGVYVAAQDVTVTKYSVTQLFTKYVYVDDSTNPTISAGRQVIWAMNVGDKGAIGEQKSENVSEKYKLTNNELLKLAIQKVS